MNTRQNAFEKLMPLKPFRFETSLMEDEYYHQILKEFGFDFPKSEFYAIGRIDESHILVLNHHSDIVILQYVEEYFDFL